jgi:hypothetical protein
MNDKIIIIYGKEDSPFIANVVFHDYQVKSWVENITPGEYHIFNDLAILAIRAAIHIENRSKKPEETVTLNNYPISLFFKNEDMKIDNRGRCSDWPKGFLDYGDQYLETLCT